MNRKAGLVITRLELMSWNKKINYQEDYSRRINLRFSCVQELLSGETLEQTAMLVMKLLEESLQIPSVKIERAHRVGLKTPSRSRVIINNFYKQIRNLTVPESEYKFIESLSSTNVNATFSILSLNIRSIPTNLQQFAEPVLACSNIHFDVLGFFLNET